MILWILFAVLTIIAAGAVLSPLLSKHTAKETRESYDIAVYKDQLKELEQDLDRGLINEQEGKAAKSEISRRLLASVEQEKQNQTERKAAPVQIKAGIAVCLAIITLVSVSVYATRPEANSRCVMAMTAAQNKNTGFSKFVVSKVENYVHRNPEDQEAWKFLAPIYEKQNCANDAAIAHGKIVILYGKDAAKIIAYGEKILKQNNGRITFASHLAFQRAFNLQSGSIKPYVYLTLALEQQGKNKEALKHWVNIYNLAKNAELKKRVKVRIDHLRKIAGVSKTDNSSDQPGNPTKEDIKAAQSMSAKDRNAMIQNMVDGLAQRLAEEGGSTKEWLRLMQSYHVLGKKKLAIKAWNDGKKNLKNDENAKNKLDQLAKKLGLTS